MDLSFFPQKKTKRSALLALGQQLNTTGHGQFYSLLGRTKLAYYKTLSTVHEAERGPLLLKRNIHILGLSWFTVHHTLGGKWAPQAGTKCHDFRSWLTVR